MIHPGFPRSSKTPSRCSGFSGGRVLYEGTLPCGRSANPTPGRTIGHTTL